MKGIIQSKVPLPIFLAATTKRHSAPPDSLRYWKLNAHGGPETISMLT